MSLLNPDDEISSTNPPERIKPKKVKPHSSSNSVSTASTAENSEQYLIVKDCNPWRAPGNERALDELGRQYRVTTSYSLENEDLSDYEVVVIPSTQSYSYYSRMYEHRDRIESFVETGGTLVAHLTYSGWPCSGVTSQSIAPGGLTASRRGSNYLSIVADDHPLVEGVSDSALDGWGSSAHGTLEDIPSDATTIIRSQYGPTAIEYSYGDGTVLASTQTLEWPWSSGRGTKRVLRNELSYATSASGGPATKTVEASATALSVLLGGNENSTDGGHPLNSALMSVLPDDHTIDIDLGTTLDFGNFGQYSWEQDVFKLRAKPLLDNWMAGDMIADKPALDLDDALQPAAKVEEFPDQEFNRYRINNHVDVSFDTTDGSIVRESIDISFDGHCSKSILEQEEIRGLDPEDVGGPVVDGGYKPRYWSKEIIEVDGTEAVRVSTIFGGYAHYGKAIVNKFLEQDVLEFLVDTLGWELDGFGRDISDLPRFADRVVKEALNPLLSFLSVTPNIFTYLDLVVLADGRRFVRMWDASMFPKHALYLDRERVGTTPLPYGERDLININLLAFFYEAATRLYTPYYAPQIAYMAHVLGRNNEDVDRLVEDIETFLKWNPYTTVGGYALEIIDWWHSFGPLLQSGSIDREGPKFSDQEIDSVMPNYPRNPFDNEMDHS
ncbi:hypothetical protein [Haloarchaeobius sp. TZWWS8]|uniref:hypothetical protein n=1 Tax=Haloarchaeobius sp. TZWWS8 TaxID=3446121 RepID=UPI003EB88D11